MGNNENADKIIKTHMVLSMVSGLVPVPILDVVAVTAVQMDMLRQLSRNYSLDFNEQSGKSIISAISGSVLARMGASSVKAIPVIGSLLGGVTMSALSGASTYAIGNVFKEHFKRGGDFSDIDINQAKDFFKEKMEEGKQMAKEMETQIKEERNANENGYVEEIKAKVKTDPVNDDPIKTNTAKSNGQEKGEAVTDKKATKTKSQSSGPKDFMEQLNAIAKMKEQGLLNEEEFAAMKKKIMDRLS